MDYYCLVVVLALEVVAVVAVVLGVVIMLAFVRTRRMRSSYQTIQE